MKRAVAGCVLWGCLAIGWVSQARAISVARPNPDGRLNPAGQVEVVVVSPQNDEVLEGPDVEVALEVTNFEVRRNGPHLHYVVDNGPVLEYFDMAQPFVLPSLPVGSHVLAVFPVTSWHESWKDDGSLALVRFHVGGEGVSLPTDLEQPLLVFNMPQGRVERWDGRWVLFDFWVKNVSIASGDTRMPGHRIRYVLDGAETLSEYWESRFWLNLAAGEHHLEIELTDAHGRSVPNGPWNKAYRTFRV